jgi:hypothetical protein
MDDFDYLEEDRPARSGGAIVWNVLTVLVLLAVLCLGSVFLMIFANPASGLNLFPPPTEPQALALPTHTPTPRGVLPPTWTPLPTVEPSLTPTGRPSATPPPSEAPPALSLPSETPFSLFTPSAMPEGSEEEVTVTPGGMPFVLAQGSPTALSSMTFHPDQGCDWMGVAGQAFNAEGAPVSTGVVIKAGGLLRGTLVDITSLTGVALQYGQAGYEIVLADEPIASTRTLWVQLLDQAGEPLSERVFFDTFEDCEKNLIFINFKQVQ